MRPIDADALVKALEEGRAMIDRVYDGRINIDDRIDFAINVVKAAPSIYTKKETKSKCTIAK